MMTYNCRTLKIHCYTMSFAATLQFHSTRCPKLPFQNSPKFDYESYHKIFFLTTFVNDPNVFQDDEIVLFVTSWVCNTY